MSAPDTKADTFAIRYRDSVAERKNVPSYSDLHRLPLPMLIPFFAKLVGRPLLFAYCWLLLTIGIDPRRLSLTQITLNPQGEAPSLHPTLPRLSFRILIPKDHREERAETHARLDFGVDSLPISDDIHRLIIIGGLPLPFSDCEAVLQAFATEHKRHVASPAPTPYRIAASHRLVVAPGHISSIAAAYLSGYLNPPLFGNARYYQLAPEEQQISYLNSHASLIERIITSPTATPALRSHVARLRKIDQFPHANAVGSTRAVPVTNLRQLLNNIHSLHDRSMLDYSCQSLAAGPQAAISLLQLASIHQYLIQQLTLGLRPVGKRANVGHSRYGSIVDDKSSAHYVEPHWVPAPEYFHRQREQLEIDVTEVCQKFGLTLYKSARDTKRNLTQFPTWSRADTHFLCMQTLTSKKCDSELRRLGLLSETDSISQIVRHSTASYLHGRVPQFLIDQFFGHHRDGTNILAPYSSFSYDAISALETHLQQFWEDLQLRPLSMRSRA